MYIQSIKPEWKPRCHGEFWIVPQWILNCVWPGPGAHEANCELWIAYGRAVHRGGGTMPSDWGCTTTNMGFSLSCSCSVRWWSPICSPIYSPTWDFHLMLRWYSQNLWCILMPSPSKKQRWNCIVLSNCNVQNFLQFIASRFSILWLFKDGYQWKTPVI